MFPVRGCGTAFRRTRRGSSGSCGGFFAPGEAKFVSVPTRILLRPAFRRARHLWRRLAEAWLRYAIGWLRGGRARFEAGLELYRIRGWIYEYRAIFRQATLENQERRH
jgi:hypothetical protein